MDTYSQAVDFLFQQTPVFQNIGGKAYKPGLERVEMLLEHFGSPQTKFRTVHVAGTNGKGSTSSLLASVLQESGLRVGLFTSPHLVDFRERIRINGEMITEEYVLDFVKKVAPSIPHEIEPSFFELTTAMAFDYFATKEIDIAVVEVGMGGRLDSTNVITPLVSVITNVSLDHTAYLGDTLAKIAFEKAGIIKPNTPVVLGRSQEPEVTAVVRRKADKCGAPLTIADRRQEILMYRDEDNGYRLTTVHFGTLSLPLVGVYQIENAATVLEALLILRNRGIYIPDEAVAEGFRKIAQVGLRGRLEVLRSAKPRIILDTGHNPGAWAYLGPQLQEWHTRGGLLSLIGMAGDKDAATVLSNLPKSAPLICTRAKGERAMPAEQLAGYAKRDGIEHITIIPDIFTAYNTAVQTCLEENIQTLFVGGSNFVVGELIQDLNSHV